jgi:hypothetical protein
MKDAIEILIQRGRLKQFTMNSEPEKHTVDFITDGKNKDVTITMSVEQLDDFLVHMEITPYACTWEQFPTVNVITGGISILSMGSMKRKFEELMSVNHLLLPKQKLGGDHRWPSMTTNCLVGDVISKVSIFVDRLNRD